MNELIRRLAAAHGEPTQADTALLTPLHELVVRRASDPLRFLLYAAGAVLLVSCLNLTTAILAQGLHRAREFGSTRRQWMCRPSR
jgi:hypothetical protein